MHLKNASTVLIAVLNLLFGSYIVLLLN